MSKILVDTIDTRSGTSNMTIGSSNTSQITLKSGATLTNFPEGITVADQWRLTTNFNGDAQPIASNLERVDSSGQGTIGTAMSESSGIFTFPSTGIYLVEFVAMATWTSTSFYHTSSIQLTTNNSSYTAVVEGDLAVTMGADSGTWYSNARAMTLVDVTDTSNVKVRFGIDAYTGSPTTRGNSTVNLTYMTFIRLGDT